MRNAMGYFKDVGLEAEIIALSNGTAATAAVLSGSADVAFSNTMSLIVAHDKGLPARIIVGTDLIARRIPSRPRHPRSSPDASTAPRQMF